MLQYYEFVGYDPDDEFQWAPTLGGECYETSLPFLKAATKTLVSMGTHPWG